MENRHGLIISPHLTAATGTAESEAAVSLVENIPNRHRITVSSDKDYDTRAFVQSLRALNAVPHVAQNCKGRRSAIDGRTTRHIGYIISQRLRKSPLKPKETLGIFCFSRLLSQKGGNRIDCSVNLSVIDMPKLSVKWTHSLIVLVFQQPVSFNNLIGFHSWN